MTIITILYFAILSLLSFQLKVGQASPKNVANI